MAEAALKSTNALVQICRASTNTGSNPVTDFILLEIIMGVCQMPKKPVVKEPVDNSKHYDGQEVKPGELRTWRCPKCKIKHTGFSRDVCRNQDCVNYAKETNGYQEG